jgi:hypothetical protein
MPFEEKSKDYFKAIIVLRLGEMVSGFHIYLVSTSRREGIPGVLHHSVKLQTFRSDILPQISLDGISAWALLKNCEPKGWMGNAWEANCASEWAGNRNGSLLKMPTSLYLLCVQSGGKLHKGCA